VPFSRMLKVARMKGVAAEGADAFLQSEAGSKPTSVICQ
jgi:hypothetical protein